jgi:hypothetical protein
MALARARGRQSNIPIRPISAAFDAIALAAPLGQSRLLSGRICRAYMRKRAQLKRKSFFVDERVLQRAKRLLRAPSDAETIRLSLERVAEMERFWKYRPKPYDHRSPLFARCDEDHQ